jgi:hypothetical protein
MSAVILQKAFTLQSVYALVAVTWDICFELEISGDSCCTAWSETLFTAGPFVFI